MGGPRPGDVVVVAERKIAAVIRNVCCEVGGASTNCGVKISALERFC